MDRFYDKCFLSYFIYLDYDVIFIIFFEWFSITC